VGDRRPARKHLRESIDLEPGGGRALAAGRGQPPQVSNPQRERMLLDGKSGLARQTTPPSARVKVIAKLNLGPAML